MHKTHCQNKQILQIIPNEFKQRESHSGHKQFKIPWQNCDVEFRTEFRLKTICLLNTFKHI